MQYTSCAPDSIIQTITLVNPTLSINASTTSCTGMATATISVQPFSGPFSYSWMPSSQSNSVAGNLAAGVYTVTVKNTSGNCVSTITANIAQAAQVSVLSSQSPACSVGSASLSVTGGSGNYNFSWSPGSYSTPVVNSVPPATYTVLVTDTQYQCAVTHTLKVNALQSPTLNVTGDLSICAGESTTLSANGVNTYSWSTGALTSTVSLTPANTSTYLVSGTGTINSCSASKSVTVNVSPCIDITEKQTENLSVAIYPNPATGKFMLSCTLKSYDLKVYDLAGVLIFQANSDKNSMELDLNDINDGVYFLQINSENLYRTLKLIKTGK